MLPVFSAAKTPSVSSTLLAAYEPRTFEPDICLCIDFRHGSFRGWAREARRWFKYQRGRSVATDVELRQRVSYVEPEISTSAEMMRVAGMVGGLGRRQVKEVYHPDLLTLTASALKEDVIQRTWRLIIL
jgi:hypothetical protein